MGAVTFDVKKSRNNISKTAKRRMTGDKTLARRQFRSRLKSSDRQTDFEGHASPTFTKLDVS